MRHPDDGSGFRCYECGNVFPAMWGDTCNGCREKERRHRELIAALAAAAPPPDRNDLLAVGRAQSQHDAGGSRSSPATVPSTTEGKP